MHNVDVLVVVVELGEQVSHGVDAGTLRVLLLTTIHGARSVSVLRNISSLAAV
jgi:hypothetical protein